MLFAIIRGVVKKNVLVMISPVSAARLTGIARFAREHDWHLMIQDRLGFRPLYWQGDGIITALRSDHDTYDAAMKMARRGIPLVDVTISRPEAKVPRVISDHVGIGRLAAAHFKERNFRNVVWFSTGWGNVHALRWHGLTKSLPDGMCEKWIAQDELLRTRRNDWDRFFRWMSRHLAAAPKPVAALTYDEADASRLLDAAVLAGIAVPEELAILSIGNDPLICEYQSVPLSSIDQNLEQGGYEAAALLERLMDGELPPTQPILIPPSGIVLRRSTDVIASSDPLVKHTLDYITANIAKPFGAAQIASQMGVSRNLLDKRFRADLSRSIGEEIMRQRLARAKLLLKNTSKTLADIAKATGFCNAAYLSNTFRKETGATPRQYRVAHSTCASPA